MKKVFFSCLLVSTLFLTKAQEKPNVFNKAFNNLMINQLTNELDENISLLFFYQDYFLLLNLNYTYKKPIYNMANTGTDNLFDNKMYQAQKILESVNFNFIPDIKESNMQLQAHYNDRILYTLNFINKDSLQVLSLISPDKESFNREITYYNGEVQSMVTNNSKLHKIQHDKNTVRIIESNFDYDYYTYDIVDNIYNNDLLVKQIIYKHTLDKNDLKIKNTVHYKYNDKNLILSEITKKRNGKVKDSTVYYYENNKIKSLAKHEEESTEYVFYRYDEEKLKTILFKKLGNSSEINYTYTDNGLIDTISFKTSNDLSTKKYAFKYNIDSKLIEIRQFKWLDYHKTFNLQHIYSFSYSENQIINGVIKATDNGRYIKEIKYDFNFLDIEENK